MFLSIVDRITFSVAPPLSFNSALRYAGNQVLSLAVTGGAREPPRWR